MSDDEIFQLDRFFGTLHSGFRGFLARKVSHELDLVLNALVQRAILDFRMLRRAIEGRRYAAPAHMVLQAIAHYVICGHEQAVRRNDESGADKNRRAPGGFRLQDNFHARSEERRVGKECRSRWSP